METLIMLVEHAGYSVLHLPQGAYPGYQARQETDGSFLAIVHDERRTRFAAITIPADLVDNRDVGGVKELIEGRLALMEGQ